MNLQIDSLNNPVTICPIQTSWKVSMNHIRIARSGVLMTQTSNLETVWLQPGPRPEGVVQNCC